MPVAQPKGNAKLRSRRLRASEREAQCEESLVPERAPHRMNREQQAGRQANITKNCYAHTHSRTRTMREGESDNNNSNNNDDDIPLGPDYFEGRTLSTVVHLFICRRPSARLRFRSARQSFRLLLGPFIYMRVHIYIHMYVSVVYRETAVALGVYLISSFSLLLLLLLRRVHIVRQLALYYVRVYVCVG